MTDLRWVNREAAKLAAYEAAHILPMLALIRRIREESMPWSKKQKQVAQAVEHGWKPKGSAKGFTEAFASQVIAESKLGKGAKPAPKR